MDFKMRLGAKVDMKTIGVFSVCLFSFVHLNMYKTKGRLTNDYINYQFIWSFIIIFSIDRLFYELKMAITISQNKGALLVRT